LGNLEEGSSTGEFEKRVKGVLGMGLLSDDAPWRGHWEGGTPSLGTLEDMFR